jgi:hypothetical protein
MQNPRQSLHTHHCHEGSPFPSSLLGDNDSDLREAVAGDS